jgi:hypothetical protein
MIARGKWSTAVALLVATGPLAVAGRRPPESAAAVTGAAVVPLHATVYALSGAHRH